MNSHKAVRYTVKASKGNTSRSFKRRIVAADGDEDDFGEDEGFGDEGDFGEEGLEEDIDDISDTVDDMQDWLDDVEEDDIDIELDANIANHYIVQCDGCHDIFISALVETDQDVEKLSGVCPCCNKPTDQYIKWIVREL